LQKASPAMLLRLHAFSAAVKYLLSSYMRPERRNNSISYESVLKLSGDFSSSWM